MSGESPAPEEHGDRSSRRTVLTWIADDAAAAAVADELAAAWRVRRMADLRALRMTVARERPDALVIDVDALAGEPRRMLGGLRADFRIAGLPLVVLVTDAVPPEHLVGLGEAADDYVTRPWAAGRLGRRLAWAVQRNADLSATTAFTGLPGPARARENLVRRMAAGEVFAYCHLDLDGFAAFNEVHGYPRGDQLVLTFAATLRRVAADLAPEPFVGHLAGDDFVLICAAEQARPACRDIADMFETDSARLYDDAERAGGALQVVDRQGQVHEIPLVTVSAGVATNEQRHFTSPQHVMAVAREMLAFAKRSHGSSVGVDRRKA